MVERGLLDDSMAIVGSGFVWDSWVEDRRSRYLLVGSITNAEWITDGMTKSDGDAGERVWGHRKLVVVSRIGKARMEQVLVKVEVF